MARIFAALAVAVAVAAAVACGGGDGGERRTGIDVVDKVIAAVEADDIEKLMSFVRFTDVPCTSTRPTSIPIVRCPTGEPDGSPVGALLSASCEGTWMEAADGATDRLRSSLSVTGSTVYAVYHPARAASEAFPAVAYAVVLTFPLNGQTAGFALLLDDEGIVGYDVDCGLPAERMAEFEHFGDAVLPPP